ncbi:aminotransferase class III-fold pyridoxal phosphate-dependent enzyme [Aquisphaera insulae]|uniref:aminotransferase class III-fold pyridoxal phosphate-dependent enzyme n=1 Tax=Aquisphaera insulae TaxID=2712864 RepID=UPI0013EAA96F|nr:aminotransferase class III-fold pyridoxal phosphate-dependent enzyme [Aquisphaera insulae]
MNQPTSFAETIEPTSAMPDASPSPLPSPLATIEPMIAEREPNLLRLYLNPHVVQACFCLDRYVRETWTARASGPNGRHGGEECQSFLANSLGEALGGAIKLVRHNRGAVAAPSNGLILDPTDRLTGFAHLDLTGGSRAEFLPGLRVIGGDQLDEFAARIASEGAGTRYDLLVLVADPDLQIERHAEAIRGLMRRDRPALIVCVDRGGLDAIRGGPRGLLRESIPDVVVFDESFTGYGVPFGAFTARRSLFAAWNRPGKSTFHSTTFQPNTVSTRHFMNCLAAEDPDFLHRHAGELAAFRDDPARRADGLGRYYSPSLRRLIRVAGFETGEIRTDGPFVVVDGRRVYDVVGGVACSVRGHNPPTYPDEMRSFIGLADRDEAELRGRLRELTGLGEILPAVSGATAVENALKLALVARFPRRHIMALKAGFGGKTLVSLAGTANPFYKENVGPLHAEVHYVDPFAADARERIDALLAEHEFAVVQVELIQSVGGVRPIPGEVIAHLDERRARGGYLLLVDEVQTGMYRTGPFVRSRALGLAPDLLLLGKATSDMIFPFALTLYSDAVAAAVSERGPALVDSIRRGQGYELGYRTVLNVLRLGDELDLSRRVAESGELFRRLLQEGLGSHKGIRDVRVFGLLIAIEIDARGGLRRRLRKRLSALYLLAMLRHDRFPLLAGFCQYEPETLKVTPPLDAGPEEIRRACETIVDVLRRPLPGVFLAGLLRILMPFRTRRKER